MNFRLENDFTKVTYKRRGKAKKLPPVTVDDSGFFNLDSNIRCV